MNSIMYLISVRFKQIPSRAMLKQQTNQPVETLLSPLPDGLSQTVVPQGGGRVVLHLILSPLFRHLLFEGLDLHLKLLLRPRSSTTSYPSSSPWKRCTGRRRARLVHPVKQKGKYRAKGQRAALDRHIWTDVGSLSLPLSSSPGCQNLTSVVCFTLSLTIVNVSSLLLCHLTNYSLPPSLSLSFCPYSFSGRALYQTFHLSADGELPTASQLFFLCLHSPFFHQ